MDLSNEMAQSSLSFALAELAKNLSESKNSLEVDKCWRSGDISYKFWPVQKKMAEVLEGPGSLKRVLKCSRRLRKTTTALALSIKTALRKKKALIRFAAATRDSLIETIFPIMDQLCDDAPDDLKPVWLAQKHHYFFPSTESIISVAGCDNLKAIGRLRGKAADLCVVDEAQEIVELRYLIDDVMMPQLMGVDKPKGPLWMLFTPPKTPVHESIKYFQQAKLDNAAAEFNIYDGGYSPEVIETFKREAGGENSTTWRREYLVEEVVDENYALAKEWKNDYIQTYQQDEYYKFYDRYVGMDIGVRDLTVLLFAVYDFKRAKLFIQDELWWNGPTMTTQIVADGIKAKEQELWGEKKPKLRIGDNNNLIFLQDLTLIHKIPFMPTSKDDLAAMVNEVRLWINQGRLIVDEKCKQLLGCLKYGVWDKNHKEFERSVAFGHFDAFAALMYLIRNIDQNTNPVPAMFGLDANSQWVNADRYKKVASENWKKVLGIKQ